MKLLFEFPRFHTNNVGMVNALIDDGHEVVFSVVRQSDIEDHSRIKPVHHKQSLASKVLCHLFHQNDAVLPLYFPNIRSHFRFLRDFQLDFATTNNLRSSEMFSLALLSFLNLSSTKKGTCI